jgi:uncharacterized membrane protein YciS (DUF1049 family)
MTPIVWKAGLAVAALFMAFYYLDLAVQTARATYHLWDAARTDVDDN